MRYVPSIALMVYLGTLSALAWMTGSDVHADDRAELVFSAPPRESCARELEVYQPLMDYLAKITGHPVVFRCPDNWLAYSKDMVAGIYDIVFDGPAFTGWRVDQLQYVPIAKLPEDFVFVVIAKTDNDRIKEMGRLAGHLVCAHAPPNLGTLILLSQFDNPARQPVIVETRGWENAMKGLMENRCAGTVVPFKNLVKYDAGEPKRFKVLYRHAPLPNQAISVGPRIHPDMRARVTQGLFFEEGRSATRKLRAVYAGAEFVPANTHEYAGLGRLLKDDFHFRH